MYNLITEIKGKELIITIDLTTEFGMSGTQKNVMIASSQGMMMIPGLEGVGVRLGLNLFRFPLQGSIVEVLEKRGFTKVNKKTKRIKVKVDKKR